MADLDGLDRQLIHALQVDGRAAFSKIASVLGVSDQTVARRYSRLRSHGRIRVTGRTDPARLGEVAWFVRIQCVPSVAVKLGQALARRPDTTWVKLTSGGTELVCVVRGPDSETLLLDRLPQTPNVTRVSANCILHVFYGGPEGAIEALSPAQVDRLRPELADRPVAVDETDRQLLDLLQTDGRATFADLAAATGLPLTTVRRRVADLRGSGVLYLDVDLDYGRVAPMQTMLWLSAAPDQLLATGQALAGHPEVPFVAATTGASNIYATVLCPGPAALFAYLATKIAALPSVRGIETAPVIRTLKQL